VNHKLILQAREKFKSLSQDAQQKIADKVSSTIIKKAGVTDELSNANLRRYCKVVEAQIKVSKLDVSGGALSKIRSNILENLPKDIYDDLKKGHDVEYLTKFFYGEPSFVKIWNDLGLDFNMFKTLLDEQAAKFSAK
jgi:hypothetical protein